jgi:hypothetical protein
LGYSERGALNAVLFEISFAQDWAGKLERLMTRVTFAAGKGISGPFTSATVFVEQSLSDFGDADAILLLETPSGKLAVFLEAKVKSSGRAKWTIQEEFDDFENGRLATLNSSNLFAQLYSKARLQRASLRSRDDNGRASRR